MSTPKIALVAITKHGANQVAQLAEKLPDADNRLTFQSRHWHHQHGRITQE
jgi:hypothetical protein